MSNSSSHDDAVTRCPAAGYYVIVETEHRCAAVRSLPTLALAEEECRRLERFKPWLYSAISAVDAHHLGIDTRGVDELARSGRLANLERRVKGSTNDWKPCTPGEVDGLLARAANKHQTTQDDIRQRLAVGAAVRYGPAYFQSLRVRPD